MMVAGKPDMGKDVLSVRDRHRGIPQPLLCLGRQQQRRRRRKAIAQDWRRDRHDLEDCASGTCPKNVGRTHGRANQIERQDHQERRDGDDGHDRDGAHVPTGKALKCETHNAGLQKSECGRRQHRPADIRPGPPTRPRRRATTTRNPGKSRVSARFVLLRNAHVG